MRRLSPTLALVLATLLAAPAAGQLPAASVPGLGALSMPTSARSDSAQHAFVRGVLLLHLFEYDRAARAFRAAQAIEPSFALAYWGEAMTATHPVWDEQDVAAGRAALAKLGPDSASRAARAPTPRERAYLGALEVLYGDGPKARRDTLYARAMERLHRDYPDDNQARLFYALAVLGLSQGVRDVPTYLRAAAIADTALMVEPRNPGAAHYLIHGVDDPEHAARGLAAARALLEEATDAGHGQHMASHIFMALGMWDDVVAANENAIRVVDAQRAAAGGQPAVCGHYPSWLEYGYLQQGRIEAARALLGKCRDRAAGSGSGPGAADPDNSLVGSYTMMRSRYVLDTGDTTVAGAAWDVAIGGNDFAALTEAFIRGYADLRLAGPADRRVARATFDGIATRIAASAGASRGAAEYVRRNRVLGLELKGLDRLSAGEDQAGLEALRRAAATEDSMAFAFGPPFVDQPAHELLAEALLERGDARGAVGEFQKALARASRRTRSLLGLARASAAAGDESGAARAARKVLEVWHAADPGLPGLAEAKQLAAGGSAAGDGQVPDR